jgi:phosphoribosylanthranilate isomerase
MTKASTLLAELREHYGEASPEVVGLFADQPIEEVKEHIATLGLTSVQLCGAEDVGYAKDLGVPVYKVIGIDPSVPISAQMSRIMVLQHRHQLAGHKIVIDTKVAGEYGGTGQTFDWEIAAELARGLKFSLAGGLTPDNVGDAVAQVHPWGVDTSSGVETDGEKDLDKVAAFVDAVRAVDDAPKPGLLSNLPGMPKLPNVPLAGTVASLLEKIPALKMPALKIPGRKAADKEGDE